MTWSAKQYVTFEDERTRPVRDLLAAIPAHDVRRAIDLGCGPGNSTEAVAARYPDAKVIGLDNSEDMIAAANKRLPQLFFITGDIASWQSDEPVDLIFANASMQWVPDHRMLYPRLVGMLTEAGTLAVQTPDNLDEPAHHAMREVAAQGPWASKLGKAGREARHTADWYYELLKPLCARVDVWRTIYHHPMKDGAAGVVEWFKGSALRPYLAALDENEQKDFLGNYREAISKAYRPLADGTVLLPFPRLFVVATR
ncbi:trans-aconitate 2-methyltransferase [Agaricicola taiwanensis]|uniref:Trans-aconitate 2-methyltransferase n=1 Tax=Agaricicola taiwanensis TaxID=591372 RepID=A0A8J2VWM0_9RHOB|nr:trans-aconitate 2-methyltransferase [Agaricicola taiwanensis]GGE41718.1 trans-aconitate 2-methyltransferase [Agaricicola taiwanensis]